MTQNTSVRKPGTLLRRARVGDYVLASKFQDCDPNDPWRVGYVCVVEEVWKPPPGFRRLSYIIGNEDGAWTDKKLYRYCRKITENEGRTWLAMYGKG